MEILAEYTADSGLNQRLDNCVRTAVNYPPLILFDDSYPNVFEQQKGDACSTGDECRRRAWLDYQQATWYAKSWYAFAQCSCTPLQLFELCT